jgi:hypothetical protein
MLLLKRGEATLCCADSVSVFVLSLCSTGKNCHEKVRIRQTQTQTQTQTQKFRSFFLTIYSKRVFKATAITSISFKITK